MRKRIVTLAAAAALSTGLASQSMIAQANDASGAGASKSPAPRVLPGEPWIVYEGPAPEVGGVGIRLIRPDGSDEHWATPEAPIGPGGGTGDGWQLFPDWSPDGERLAFVVDTWPDPAPTRDLWVADADGTDTHQVFDCAAPCWVALSPAWSDDGGSLLFSGWDHDGRGSDGSWLRRVDLATEEVSTLAETQGPEYLVFPRWSSDERAVVAQLDTYSDISDAASLVTTSVVVVDLTSTPASVTRVSGDDLVAEYPDWHPSEELIVFSAHPTDDPSQPAALYTVRPDGSDRQLLAADEINLAQPTWLPDGSGVIAMRVGSDIATATMVIVDGSDGTITSVTPEPAFGTHPRMRPGTGPS